MASHDNKITHVCLQHHSQSQQRIYRWHVVLDYDANYCQKAEATLNKDWSAIDTSLFSQCFTGRARKALAVSTAALSNMIHQSASARRGSTQAMRKSTAFIQNNKNKGWMYASTGTYNHPCHTIHAATNMNASSASQKSTLTWIFQRGLKRDTLKKTDH